MTHMMCHGVHIHTLILILINNVKYSTSTLTIESTFVNTLSNCLNVKILMFSQFCCDVNKQI
jgi:hypothetical protein